MFFSCMYVSEQLTEDPYGCHTFSALCINPRSNLQVDDLTAGLEAARARLAEAPAVEARAFAAERARVEVSHYPGTCM